MPVQKVRIPISGIRSGTPNTTWPPWSSKAIRVEAIGVFAAPANTVGSYGQFTRVASIYETPTLLLVTPSGEVKPPIMGLADGFSIEQAIDEKTQP